MLLIAIILLGAFLFRERGPISPSVTPQPPSAKSQVPSFGAAGEPDALRVWLGDRHLSGGEVSRPGAKILRTLDSALYQQARIGDFRYDIPLKPGIYQTHLHVAEILGQGSFAYGGESSGRFHVTLNGKPLLTDFDVALDAPGPRVADERVFTDVSPAPDEYLHLQFSSAIGRAVLSGIEVRPGTPNRMFPARLVSRFRGHYDRDGFVCEADRYCQGGAAAMRPVPLSGSDESRLYTSERFCSFSYSIPVAESRYGVRLSFAESGFGLERTAGASNKALVKSSSSLTPNPRGKLVLSYVPVEDHATIQAIELVDERR